MEDEKIYFRVPMPGQLKLDEKIFDNFDDFIKTWSAESTKWSSFENNQDYGFIWEIFSEFRNSINTSVNTKIPALISAGINNYYKGKEGAYNVFFPSWTTIGSLLSRSYSDNASREGCVCAIYEKLPQIRNIQKSDTKKIASYLNAFLLKSGVSLPPLEDFYGETRKFELEHARVITEARIRMDEMKAFYDAKMKLKAPVLYWRRKAARHMKRRNCAFYLTFVSALLGAGILLLYLIFGHGLLTEEMHGWPWAFVCGFLLLVSFVFWAVRFFARIYNQQETLYNDARERVAMTKTFIALTSDETTKKAITRDEHIGIVLASLFRPSTCSFSNDGPAAPIETVANAVRRTSD